MVDHESLFPEHENVLVDEERFMGEEELVLRRR